MDTAHEKLKADVVIIGAGAIGSAIARELSKYKLDVILLEKNEDIGGNASKSNSATIVCGYDYEPGSLDGRLAVAANPMYDRIAEELDVSFRRIGEIQLAMTPEEVPLLEEAQQNAMANGVYDTQLLTAQEVRELEPGISDKVAGGLLIPRQGIIDVFELMIAYVENAVFNGVRLMTGTKAENIITQGGAVKAVVTSKGEILTRYVINAAGLYADEIAACVGINDFENYPRKGEFYLLDKNLPYAPEHILAPIPNELSRGKLLTPTDAGNLLMGPTAENITDKTDTSTTAEGLAEVLREVKNMVPAVNPRDSVTQFAGLRPKRRPKDEMCIRTSEDIFGYIEANGTSAGVTISPAAAVYVADLLKKTGLKLERKPDFNPIRKGIRRFNKATAQEQDEMIRLDPRYANIICRCETVSEAEIIEAIRRGAHSVDGVKRRLRAGMGRCQGGFCLPRVIEILSRELNVPAETICKNEPGSEYLTGENKAPAGKAEQI